jgi:hypothetical protein
MTPANEAVRLLETWRTPQRTKRWTFYISKKINLWLQNLNPAWLRVTSWWVPWSI